VPFEFRKHPDLPDIVIVRPRVLRDDRGWFQETFKQSDFATAGITAEFRQDNHVRSTALGVLRGLHYQVPPMAQAKLVRCGVGAVYDVVVDIRQDSPTFRKWAGVQLSAENQDMLWIPEGFAHGYCTLTNESEVLYKTTSEYSAAHERCIRWNDPALKIRWPVESPVLSTKDANAPLL
jgi:dTDP-4-dehydrorhamnose 3,5-epimerase